MEDIEKYLVSPNISVKEAIEKISETGKKAVFIVDENKKLLGLFSDGDMRNYVLKNGNLSKPVKEAMNPAPIVLKATNEAEFKNIIKSSLHIVYPIVDEQGRIIDAAFWNQIKDILRDNPAFSLPENVHTVIMAGGLGRRLYPYTKVLPKALIPIGEYPICTHVINNFRKYGCHTFDLILNHKKNMIKAYYSEEKKDYNINFYDETEFLGTAGGLSMLKGKISDTFFVSNCDILVEADYSCIYKFHKKEKNLITVIGALKDVQIPYGIIHVEGKESAIHDIEEKPKFSFLTNVGVYVLEPEVVENMKSGEFVDMTDIITQYIKSGKKVGVFPVPGDSWLDMGQIEEMKQMTAALEKRMER